MSCIPFIDINCLISALLYRLGGKNNIKKKKEYHILDQFS